MAAVCRTVPRYEDTLDDTRWLGLRLRRDNGLGSVRLQPDLDEHALAVRLKPDTTEARARAVLSALFVQEACNNYIPIDVNKEYTAVVVCESMGRPTSDALAKVARRATESVNECRPTRLLFAPVQSKAAPSAKKLAPIEIGLDEKGSASILRTKFGCRHDMRGDIGQLLGRPFEDPLIAGGVICTAIVISDNDLRLNADSHGRSGTGRAFMVPVRRTVMPAVN